MNKRERFIAQLRADAKALGLPFKITMALGKVGHAMVWVGMRATTLPSREIDLKTEATISKTLGL